MNEDPAMTGSVLATMKLSSQALHCPSVTKFKFREIPSRN